MTLFLALEGHREGITCLAFDLQGEVLATGSEDETVKLWDPASGQLLRTLEKLQGKVTSVAFDPHGETLAVGTANKDLLRVWEVSSGTLVRKVEHESVNSLAFDPRGGMVAGGSSLRKVKLWEPGSGKLLRTLAGHDKAVNSVVFHPSGGILASASDDEKVRLWDVDSGSLLHTLERPQKGGVKSVAFEAKGELLASGSADSTVKVWETRSGRLLRSLEGHRSLVEVVAFSPDGCLLASRSRDHTIRLWSCETWKTVAIIPVPTRATSSAQALAFHPKLPLLATARSEPGTPDEERSRLVHLLELDYSLLLGPHAVQASVDRVVPPAMKDRAAEGASGAKKKASTSRVGDRKVRPKAAEPIQVPRDQAEGDLRRGLSDQPVRFEQAVSRLRKHAAEQNLARPRVFISYARGVPEHERWVVRIATDLQNAGCDVLLDQWENARSGKSVARFVERIEEDSCIVVIVGTLLYGAKTRNLVSGEGSIVAAEWDLVSNRMVATEDQKQTVLPILLEGDKTRSLPPLLRGRVFNDFRKEEDYFTTAFQLLLDLHELPASHPAVSGLWGSLREGPP